MQIAEILSVLEGASAAFSISEGVGKIVQWLRNRNTSNTVEPQLQAALIALQQGATVEQILKVIEPFYASEGGDVLFKAGDDGGGNLVMTGVDAEAGTGKHRGGSIRIAGGDGGPNGSGGTVTISQSRFKGGNAS